METKLKIPFSIANLLQETTKKTFLVYICFYKEWNSNSFHTSGTPGKHQCMQSE